MTQVEKMVQENVELSETVYNLRLYMTALKETVVSPDDWAAFEKQYSGLGGFVEVSIDD